MFVLDKYFGRQIRQNKPSFRQFTTLKGENSVHYTWPLVYELKKKEESV